MKRSALQTVLYAVLTVSTLFVLFSAYSAGVTQWGYYVLAVAFFFLSCVFSPVLHELGHVACGKACGMFFVSLSFSLLTVYEEENKLRFKWNAVRPDSTAGACRMYPKDEKNVEKKLLFFAAGGVIFNGLYLVTGLFFTFFFNNGILWLTLGMTLPYCAYLLIVNLLPNASEEGAFDGAVIFGLLKKEPSAATMANLLAVQGYVLRGVTPAAVPEKLYFSAPQLPEDDVNFASVQLWRYAYYLDGGEKEKAAKCAIRLESCMEYISDAERIPVYCELTYVYSLLKPDKVKAEKYYGKLLKGEIPDEYAADACRAEAAYALMNGENELAARALGNAESAIARGEESGMKKFRAKLTAELSSALNKGVN